MESKSTISPVSPLALTERQLSDWQQLLTQLEASPAPPAELTYCLRQINRLSGEVYQLKLAAIQAQINELPNDNTADTYQRYNELKAQMNNLIGY